MAPESQQQEWSDQIDPSMVEAVETFGDYKPSATISVVVVTYNRPDALITCLAAIRNQTYSDFETVVVDNRSDVLPDLSEYSVKLVKLKKNLGPGAGRNFGAAYSEAKLVVFLDDDSIPDEKIVESYARALIDGSDCYAARGRVLPDRPTIYSSFEPIFDLGEDQRNAFLTVESNVAILREQLQEVGGWETGITCHEGLALSYRLVESFGRDGMIYLPDAVVLHGTVRSLRGHLQRRLRFASTREELFARMPELAEFAATRSRPPAPAVPKNPITRLRLHIVRYLTRIVIGPPSPLRSLVMWSLRLRDK